MEDQAAHTSTGQTSVKSNNTVKIVGAILVVAILAYIIWEFGLKGKNAGEFMRATPTPTESGSMEASPGDSMTSSYKDGVYSAIGKYQNPAGGEDLEVTITLANGNITAATFTGTPDNPTTVTMQNRFKQGFETEVVGKPIDEVNMTIVNGSSLTPKGFMDALSQIKSQAQG